MDKTKFISKNYSDKFKTLNSSQKTRVKTLITLKWELSDRVVDDKFRGHREMQSIGELEVFKNTFDDFLIKENLSPVEQIDGLETDLAQSFASDQA